MTQSLKDSYHLSNDGVDSRTVRVRVFGQNFGPLLLPVQHEGVGRLLDVLHVVILLDHRLSLSVGKQNKTDREHELPLCKTVRKETNMLTGTLVHKSI